MDQYHCISALPDGGRSSIFHQKVVAGNRSIEDVLTLSYVPFIVLREMRVARVLRSFFICELVAPRRQALVSRG
jgi:hypothetical protein